MVSDRLILLQRVREPVPARVAALRVAKENTAAGFANSVVYTAGASACGSNLPEGHHRTARAHVWRPWGDAPALACTL